MSDNKDKSVVKGIAGLNIRTILEILALVRRLNIKELAKLPDVDNPVEVRKWLLSVFRAVAELAKYTNTKLDDDFVAQAILLIEEEQSWASIYSLISFVYDLIKKDDAEPSEVVARQDVVNAAEAAGKRVGVNPLLIIGIVQAAVALLRLLQQWRQNRNR